jgi:hypothetical protein
MLDQSLASSIFFRGVVHVDARRPEIMNFCPRNTGKTRKKIYFRVFRVFRGWIF